MAVDNETELQLTDNFKKLISWFMSEMWESYCEVKTGIVLEGELQLERAIDFLKTNGISEEEMGCLKEISDDKVINLVDALNKW